MKRLIGVLIALAAFASASDLRAERNCLSAARSYKAQIEAVLKKAPTTAFTSQTTVSGLDCGDAVEPILMTVVSLKAQGLFRKVTYATRGIVYGAPFGGAAFCDDGRVFLYDRQGDAELCR